MNKIIFLIILRWLGLILIIFIIDLLSKQWIVNNIMLYNTQKLLPFLNFFHVHNYGGVFGFLANAGGWQRWLFVIVAVLTIIMLMIIMYVNKEKMLSNVSYTFIIGGALGNLFDRLYRGFVVDFIDFYIGDWHFATFNIADCCIFIGAILRLLDFFINSKNCKKNIIV